MTVHWDPDGQQCNPASTPRGGLQGSLGLVSMLFCKAHTALLTIVHFGIILEHYLATGCT